MAPNETQSLDGILNQITTATNVSALNNHIRNSLPKESRDTILASSLPGGQDPLSVLDLRANTLGVLYILSARLTVTGASLPTPHLVENFCRNFIPEQARYAPDRVTMLAKGIARLASFIDNQQWSIQPLYNLLTRYAPDSSYLTTIHPLFVLACVTTRNFTAALPIILQPITTIDTNLSDLHYNDNLVYHYVSGIALAALKRFSEAEDYFEICVASPGLAPSALQLEALKKLRLVQLISRGKIEPLPKYANAQVIGRLFKGSPYQAFVNAYPGNVEQMLAVLDSGKQTFSNDKNMGLITQAIEHAPRWTLKKLTATYLTLGLSEIGKAIKVDSEDDVRELVLSMIDSKEICAKISSAPGAPANSSTALTVTFSDPPPEFTKRQIDDILQEVQKQTAYLTALDMELARNRDYLRKAVKGLGGGDDVGGGIGGGGPGGVGGAGPWGGMGVMNMGGMLVGDEEVYSPLGAGGWLDE